MQVSNTEIQLHKARMYDIRGNQDEALAIYCDLARNMCEYARQFPQYTEYYKQYYNMIQEEVTAIQEMQQKRKKAVLSQSTASSSNQYYSNPPSIPPKPASLSPLPVPNEPYQMQQAPVYYGDNATNAQQQKPTLTNSDIMYAARGVGNRVREFDQQHGVSDKCKQVANVCVQKAKDLDQEYEIRKKAAEFGQSVKEWDERNGVSKALINGVKQVATSVGTAVKGFADKTRAEETSRRDLASQPYFNAQTTTSQGYPGYSDYPSRQPY